VVPHNPAHVTPTKFGVQQLVPMHSVCVGRQQVPPQTVFEQHWSLPAHVPVAHAPHMSDVPQLVVIVVLQLLPHVVVTVQHVPLSQT
jgi:hypothetical protein